MDYNVQIITLIAELQSDRTALREQVGSLGQQLTSKEAELEELREQAKPQK